MPITLTALRNTQREPLVLPDGVAYPVKDLTIGGAELLELTEAEIQARGRAYVDAMLDEAAYLTGAPLAVIKRASFNGVVEILLHAADRLAAVRSAIDAAMAAAGEATAPADGATPGPEGSPTDATGSASP